MKIFHFFLLLIISTAVNFAQNQVNTDSLLRVIENEKDISEKLKSYRILLGQELNDSTHQYAREASELVKEIENRELQISVYSIVGQYYTDQGYFSLSLKNYLKAVQISEELISEKSEMEYEDYKRLYYLYNSMGISYYSKLDLDKAILYFEKSLNLVSTIEFKYPEKYDVYTKALILNNLGSMNMEFNPHKSLEYLLLLFELLDDEQKINPEIYNNLGLAYFNTGNNKKALDAFAKGLAKAEKEKNTNAIIQLSNNLAQLYVKTKEYNKAIEYLNIAKENLNEEDVNISKMLNNLHFYRIYEGKGDYKNALKYHVAYKNLNDSISQARYDKQVILIEQEYEFEKKNQEIIYAQKIYEAKQHRKELIYITIAVTSLLAVIILILLYVLQRNKANREKLKKEQIKLKADQLEKDLDYRNKELATNVMYLVRKNELINNISNRLLDLKADLKKMNQEPVQSIISELQRNVDNDTWKEFELRFQEVHEDFYTKLNEKYPDLTPNEKKLCAFLRLNMTTKEISTITFQSLQSIKVARTRLRKKLNINNEDVNLVDFLINI